MMNKLRISPIRKINIDPAVSPSLSLLSSLSWFFCCWMDNFSFRSLISLCVCFTLYICIRSAQTLRPFDVDHWCSNWAEWIAWAQKPIHRPTNPVQTVPTPKQNPQFHLPCRQRNTCHAKRPELTTTLEVPTAANILTVFCIIPLFFLLFQTDLLLCLSMQVVEPGQNETRKVKMQQICHQTVVCMQQRLQLLDLRQLPNRGAVAGHLARYPPLPSSLPQPLDLLRALLTFAHPSTCTGPNCTSPHTPDGSGLQLTRPVSLHPSWPFGNLRSRVCDLHFQLFAELCADELGTRLRLTVESSTPAHPSPCHTTAQTTDAPTNAPASKDDFFQNKP